MGSLIGRHLNHPTPSCSKSSLLPTQALLDERMNGSARKGGRSLRQPFFFLGKSEPEVWFPLLWEDG
ncbi:MAG: hypothetical protein HC780_01095 [Leptolyngbyaceae cyanobacterium CSU_1_3]|nr:hypothetical protein [Leptolyngbyaceae cyanobacterium CSU_1_3]